LFALYERLRAQGGMLVLAARPGPAAIGLRLADLATRLSAGLVYQLQPLSDVEKIAALRLRAQRRGLDMTEEVANYLLTRFPRDMHSLFALLDKLDTATLAAQRRLTIATRDSAEGIELLVADRGRGIEATQRDKVFESFVTTKPNGMGLGLSIVRAIAEAHGGRITFAARDGGGTVFTLSLPRRSAAPAEQQEDSSGMVVPA